MNVPGEDLKKVTHYYKTHIITPTQKVAVIGAKQFPSVDAPGMSIEKEAEVSLIIRGQEVGQRVKYWVRPDYYKQNWGG